MRLTIAGRVAARPDKRRAVKVSSKWLMVILATAVGLGILAWAETVWLEEALPRDHVARTSLTVMPSDGETITFDRWAEMVNTTAGRDEVLATVISKLDLRDGSFGGSVSPAELRQRMRFNAQCVEVPNGEGVLVRGALLSTTVRGQDDKEVSTIAATWEEAFLQASSGVAAKLLEGPAAPYLPCEGR